METPVYNIGDILKYFTGSYLVTVIAVDGDIVTMKPSYYGRIITQSAYHVSHFYRKLTPLEQLL